MLTEVLIGVIVVMAVIIYGLYRVLEALASAAMDIITGQQR
jgi:hypothetical protein